MFELGIRALRERAEQGDVTNSDVYVLGIRAQGERFQQGSLTYCGVCVVLKDRAREITIGYRVLVVAACGG